MKLFLRIILVSVFAVFLAGNAMADSFTFGDGGAALQGVLNDITVGGDSSVDVTQDALSDSSDSYWDITGSGGSIATIIIELAGFADENIFGVYDQADENNKVEIFAGAEEAGAQIRLSITQSGKVYLDGDDTGKVFAAENFGYYLDSSANIGGAIFYSDTSLNTLDNLDHMAAYEGKGDTIEIEPWDEGTWTDNEYVLAFEDLVGPVNPNNPDIFGGTTGFSDRDFTDFVVMVESVEPIPEPATMFLLGLGLVGLAGVTRKKIV